MSPSDDLEWNEACKVWKNQAPVAQEFETQSCANVANVNPMILIERVCHIEAKWRFFWYFQKI